MLNTVQINGSHGTLIVDRVSGIIVDAIHDGDEDYRNIALFDVTVFDRLDRGHCDILETGYWTHDGLYAEPLTMRCLEMRGEMFFDDWVEMKMISHDKH